jgi:uncharacterized protein YbaR (Trm112 family)/SAM-dependent methyltransferase
MKLDADTAEMLVCPTTKLPLEVMSRSEAESRMGGALRCRPDQPNASGSVTKAAGVTETVLVREDLKCAYPVLEGIPVLLAPESLTVGAPPEFDLTEPQYAEAYEEMEFYNSSAAGAMAKLENGGAWAILPTEMAATEDEKVSFPAPWQRWIDTPHDSAALWDAYVHLGKMGGKCVLQLGGSGTHAIKFAMVGAAETWLVTPMVGEAAMARALADSAGIGDRFRSVVAIAEELPFRDGSFDGIFAGGCLHHMLTEIALPEAARILRVGGRFAATEPWRAPLYSIGTKMLGKREHAYCKPLTAQRLEPLKDSFSASTVIGHGTLSRYPFLALEKFGVPISKTLPWHIGKIDDAICSLIPAARRMGSSVAVLGTK